MRKLSLIPLFVLGFCHAVCAQEAAPTFADEVRSGFYSRLNGLGFALYQDIAVASRNPLEIPRDQVELNFRPDLNLKLRQFEFDLKPRFQWSRARVLHPEDRTQSKGYRQEVFVNEGSVRYRAFDSLILSYGRENLQWGPSLLLSPSNPFNANNGRNNPNLELPGMSYARAVLVASPTLTLSLISNTGRGRLDPSERYRKASAVKLDYTGDAAFASLIVSRAEHELGRIGGFAGWNVSDALSVRLEGSAGRVGVAATGPGDQPARRDRQLLAGASYTLESGPTLSAEYFFNKDGCADLPIEFCLLHRGALVDPVRPLARTRYAMLQYVQTKIGGNLNLSSRLIRDIDDRSSQLVVNVEYELGAHWQLYLIPTFYRGNRGSEFGSVLRRSLFGGASYTF